MTQSSNLISTAASGVFNTAIGTVVGGPAGGVIAAGMSLMDYRLGYKDHDLARFGTWNGILLSIASNLSGVDVGMLATTAIMPAGYVIARFTADFLDFGKKIDPIAANSKNLYITYAEAHPEIKECETNPWAIAQHIDTPFLRNIAYQQSLNLLKIGTNLTAVYLLGKYAKSDFVLTFLSAPNDEQSGDTNHILDGAKVIAILSLQKYIDTLISNAQNKLTIQLKSEIEIASTKMVTNLAQVNKILSTTKGQDALLVMTNTVCIQMQTVSQDINALVQYKLDQITGFGIILSTAHLLIPFQIIISQFTEKSKKQILEQKNAFQKESDSLAIQSQQIKSYISLNRIDLLTSGAGEFTRESLLQLITAELDLKLRESKADATKSLLVIRNTQAENICNILAFTLSFYYSKLTLSQVPLIQSQLVLCKALFANDHGPMLTYANQAIVMEALEAVSHESTIKLIRNTSADGNFHIRDYKLSINGQLRIQIDDLSFEPGKHYVFKATSGVGKSTMLKTILGQKSSVTEVEGALSLPDNPNHKTSILLVSQDVCLITGVSLLENILLRKITSMGEQELITAKQTIIQLLEALNFNAAGNLDDLLLSDHFEWASGGQKKKLALIRAILQNPKILILDETFAGMDNISLEKACQVLDELKDTVILIVSQNAEAENVTEFYDYSITLGNVSKGETPVIIGDCDIFHDCE